MAKFLFLILSLSFVLQTTGTTLVIKKVKQSTEQCPDDNKSSEESGKLTFKKDHEQLNQFLYLGITLTTVLPTATEIIHYYPTGFFSKPFMPPK